MIGHRSSGSIVATREPIGAHLNAVLVATLLMRVAGSASGIMLLLYLGHIDRTVRPISPNTVGLLSAAFYAAELLLSSPMGALSDRFGSKLFILAGALLGAAASQLTAVSVLLPLLITTRLVQGLSSASSIPATLGYLSAATEHSHSVRARVMSYFEIATIAGMALGASLGGFIWELGKHSAFTWLAIVYLISAGLYAYGVQSKARTLQAVHHNWRSYIDTLRQPRLLRFAPAWLALNAIIGLWLAHFPFQLVRLNHTISQSLVGAFNGQQQGLIFAGYGLSFVAGVYLWSLIFPRYRKTSIMLVSLGGVFLMAVALLVLNHIPLGNLVLVVPLILILIVAVVIESGFTPVALTYLADLSEEHSEGRGAIMGFYSVLLGLGNFLGGVLGGPFATRAAIDGIISLTVILALISLATVILLRRSDVPKARVASPLRTEGAGVELAG